jgi:hypothetical protein
MQRSLSLTSLLGEKHTKISKFYGIKLASNLLQAKVLYFFFPIKKESGKVSDIWKQNLTSSFSVNSHQFKTSWFSKVILTSQLSTIKIVFRKNIFNKIKTKKWKKYFKWFFFHIFTTSSHSNEPSNCSNLAPIHTSIN